MSTKTATTSPTARKVVGSLGAAAAVAGMGTSGSFTDSTSVDTTITSGTVSIDLAQRTAAGNGVQGKTATLSLTFTGTQATGTAR